MLRLIYDIWREYLSMSSNVKVRYNNLQTDPVDGDTIDSIIPLVLHILFFTIQSKKIIVFCYHKCAEILLTEVFVRL